MAHKRAGKYGMRFSTIRYWQNRAHDLRLMVGWPSQFSRNHAIESLSRPTASPSVIAETAIMLAYVGAFPEFGFPKSSPIRRTLNRTVPRRP